MKTRTWVVTGALLVSGLVFAQGGAGPGRTAPAESGRLTLPDFRALETLATESTIVTVGPWLLHFASHFVDNHDPDSAATKRLLANIKSITIHSYEFDRDFVYSQADVDAVRAQLQAPNWNRLAQVRDKDRKNVDVYVSMENAKTTGLAVISSEPRELTIVNIIGSISSADMQQLGRHIDVRGVSVSGTDAGEFDAERSPPAT